MKKNILIIGCGKMGISHLKAFVDKPSINVYLYDKKKKKLNFFLSKNILH